MRLGYFGSLTTAANAGNPLFGKTVFGKELCAFSGVYVYRCTEILER